MPMGVNNLFDQVPPTVPHELTDILVDARHVRIERIVSYGHASPEGVWYDQAEDEFVLVVQGAARLRLGDDVIAMGPGDFLDIPAHRRHRVEWTTPDEPTIWFVVFYERAHAALT